MYGRAILIQNYHPYATAALIRDFKAIGFRVYSPDTDWQRIGYFAPNDGLGGELISLDDYLATPPGHLLITCKAQEEDLKSIARQHGDRMILSIAQQNHVYEPGISDVLICPDIGLYEKYPDDLRHRLLYFPRPILSAAPVTDRAEAFVAKRVASYIGTPGIWKEGYPAFLSFRDRYPHECRLYGHESPDGILDHAGCNRSMAASYFTVHFKEEEAYGLSCLESMMLGTPIASLHRFMADKTLGRFFLDDRTAVLADTLDALIERLEALSLAEYEAMSLAARERVLDLTSDANTIDRLRIAMQDA